MVARSGVPFVLQNFNICDIMKENKGAPNMKAIFYKVLAPGKIQASKRLAVTINERVSSLTENLTSSFIVDPSESLSSIDEISSGDIVVIDGFVYLVKTIDGHTFTGSNIINLFQMSDLATGVVTTSDITSYITSLIQTGISMTQMQNAFTVNLTSNGNAYKHAASIPVDTSISASEQTMAAIPDMYYKAIAASLYERIATLKAQPTSASQIGLYVDAHEIKSHGVNYFTEQPHLNRGVSKLSINDKQIDFNAANVKSTDGKVSQIYYLNQDGSVTTSLPSWITSIRATGNLYDSTQQSSTPDQIAKSVLPTSQGANLSLTISKTSPHAPFAELGNIWTIQVHNHDPRVVSRTLKGTITQLKETSDDIEITFGFNNPHLTLTF